MRLSRRAILLISAGAIAVITVALLRGRLTEAPAQAPAEAVRVLIAKRDLAVGTFVQGAADLDWGDAPSAPPPAAALEGAPADPPPDSPASAAAPKEPYLYEGSVKLTDFNGAIVRRALQAGDPVTQSALMKSGEGGFMSAVLEAGMRAVSIGVTATSGNAGFVSPGDRIDLIVTHRVRTPGGTDDYVVSETFVRDVRVVAVDQMTDNPENKAILAKTITVEVSPRQAEEVAVAGDMGKISIALRSLVPANAAKKKEEGGDDAKPNPLADLYGAERAEVHFTRDSDISELLGQKSANQRVRVIRGATSENVEFDQRKQ